jgi:hypothetical protein
VWDDPYKVQLERWRKRVSEFLHGLKEATCQESIETDPRDLFNYKVRIIMILKGDLTGVWMTSDNINTVAAPRS